MEELVYLNGEIKPISEAYVDLDDRGYTFADGVYEVVAIYNGKPFKMKEHFERLKQSAEAIEIESVDHEHLMSEARKFIEKRTLPGNSKIYIQVTRGTEPRNHAYSDDLKPNIFMTVRSFKPYPEEYFTKGVKVITIPDERWPNCYIKTIALLPNALGKQKAKRAGAFEAVQIRDGYVMEGTSSNIFIVKNGVIITPPATNYILNGITRQVVIEEARKLGYTVKEKSISLDELFAADEVFLTGTTTEVMPVTRIDDKLVFNGEIGPISRKLSEHYHSLL